MWDDKQIDAAIDETARQMTAGEPRADFRARVLARLDAKSSLSFAGFTIRSWRPVLAGLAAAALIIVLAVSRDWHQPASRVASAPAAIVRLPEANPTSKVPMTPDRDGQLEARLKPDATYERVAQGFLGPPKRGTREGGSPAIPALKGCATTDCDGDALELLALEMDSIAVTALAASDSIDIDPLLPAPSIAVTPLDVENEGDRR
jgi:hypothetical protein